jgi:type II secretory ATPase GspE/PulE/Tfp pilus assembly ATPase PilB-like protein
MDMGIEPFLLCSSVTCSIAQRLVRLVCPKCKEEYEPEAPILQKLAMPIDHVYVRGRGCEYCARTGFRGRTAIYEILEIDSDIRRMVLGGRQSNEIREAAEQKGMILLRTDARNKVLQGVTTVDEVIRVTAEG